MQIKLLRQYRKIIFFMIFSLAGALLIIDLILMGSGQWSETFGVPARRILFLIIVVSSLVLWLQHGLSLCIINTVIGLALFIIIWALMIPALRGIPLRDALSDSQLFWGLLFAPAIAFTTVRIGCWKSALQLIERLIWALALMHITIYWYNASTGNGEALVHFIRSILEPSQIDDETSVFIGPVGEQYRVFWGSSVFLLLGIYLTACRFKNRAAPANFVLIFIIFYAIYISMTRALILSIPLFFLSTWSFAYYLKWVRLNPGFYILVGICLFGMTLAVIVFAEPRFLELIGLGREMSDDVRFQQLAALTNGFAHSPFFGTGFGSYVNPIRSEDAPWSYELSILALYMKIGFFGIVALLFLFVLAGSSLTNKLFEFRRLPPKLIGAFSRLIALLVCIVFSGNTNPYLFSFLGWGLFIFVSIELMAITHRVMTEESPA